MVEFGAAVACFFATLLAMAALRPVAVAVELVDKPGGRKTHHGEIPVVGGIAMFVGCIFGVGLLPAKPLRFRAIAVRGCSRGAGRDARRSFRNFSRSPA